MIFQFLNKQRIKRSIKRPNKIDDKSILFLSLFLFLSFLSIFSKHPKNGMPYIGIDRSRGGYKTHHFLSWKHSFVPVRPVCSSSPATQLFGSLSHWVPKASVRFLRITLQAWLGYFSENFYLHNSYFIELNP